jgi:hypothetical protein
VLIASYIRGVIDDGRCARALHCAAHIAHTSLSLPHVIAHRQHPMSDSSSPAAAAAASLREEFGCALCHSLLHEPVALLCGHSYCRACVKRALSVQPLCPLCRAPCHLDSSSVAPNFLLQAVIGRLFPEEARERAAEHAAVEEELNSTRLGLFFLPDTDGRLVPHTPVELYVWEPRYLELMRRCMDNSTLFGVCASPDSGSGAAVAIQSCRPLPHGRLHVVARVRTRFRVTGSRPAAEPGTFGLHYGTVTFFEDLPVRADGGALVDGGGGGAGGGGGEGGGVGEGDAAAASSSTPLPELAQISAPAARALRALTEPQACTLLRDAVSAAVLALLAELGERPGYGAGAVQRVHERYGPPPGTGGASAGAERWSFYAAGVLALSPEERRAAFETRSTLRRLVLCYGALERIERAGRGAGAGAGAGDGGAEQEQQQRLRGLAPLTGLRVEAALDILNPTTRGARGWVRRVVETVAGSTALRSLLLLGVLLVVLVFLKEGRAGRGEGG